MYRLVYYFILQANGTQNRSATTSTHKEFMHCDHNWHAIPTMIRVAPDASDFLSALIRSDGSARFECGSYLDDDEKVSGNICRYQIVRSLEKVMQSTIRDGRPALFLDISKK